MATIKKRNARTYLADANAETSVSNFAADGGLRFNLTIGDLKVSLSHVERDEIIATWAKLEKEFEA